MATENISEPVLSQEVNSGFVQVAYGPTSSGDWSVRKTIPTIELDAWIDTMRKEQPDKALGATLQSYLDEANCQNGAPDGPHVINLYFDFDSDESPEKALADVRRFLEKYYTRYGNFDGVEIFFSGKKGFALTIDGRLFGVKPDVRNTLANKAMAAAFKETHSLTTLDLAVYSMRRIVRIENTPHQKSHLFKIRLTPDELNSMGMDDIRKLAEKTRVFEEKAALLVSNEKMVELWNIALDEADIVRSHVPTQRTGEIAIEPLIKGKPDKVALPQKIRKYLEEGTVNLSGSRNNTRFAIALAAIRCGYGKDEVLSLLFGYNNNLAKSGKTRDSEEKIRAQLNQIYQQLQNGQYAVEPIEAALCPICDLGFHIGQEITTFGNVKKKTPIKDGVVFVIENAKAKAKVEFHGRVSSGRVTVKGIVVELRAEKGVNIPFIRAGEVSAFGDAKQKLAKSLGMGTENEKDSEVGLGKIELPLEKFEFFLDQVGDAYARFDNGDHKETWAIDSRGFKRIITTLLMTQCKLTSEKIKLVENYCEALASSGGLTHELHNRMALFDGVRWVDMCDKRWRAVKIVKEGWEIVENPPIYFRRFSHQKEFIVELGTAQDYDALLQMWNFDSDSRILIEGYNVALFASEIEKAILNATGAQGSSKSTLFEAIRATVDPSLIPLIKMPKDPQELEQTLDHHYYPCFDNISELSTGQSDALCRGCTGEGSNKRSLYTNDDDFIRSYKRPIGLNGINVPGMAPDLLDRTLPIELERISPSARKPKRLIVEKIEVLLPKVRGYLLSTFSKAIALQPTVEAELKELPRMADFCIAGESACRAMGRRPGAFVEAYMKAVGNTNRTAVEGNIIGTLILELLEHEETHEASPATLYSTLCVMAEGHKINIRGSDWPKGPTALSRKINTLKTPLEELGVKISSDKVHKGRLIKISKIRDAIGAWGATVTANGENATPSVNETKLIDLSKSDASDAIVPLIEKENEGGVDGGAEQTADRNNVPPHTSEKCGTCDTATQKSENGARRQAVRTPMFTEAELQAIEATYFKERDEPPPEEEPLPEEDDRPDDEDPYLEDEEPPDPDEDQPPPRPAASVPPLPKPQV